MEVSPDALVNMRVHPHCYPQLLSRLLTQSQTADNKAVHTEHDLVSASASPLSINDLLNLSEHRVKSQQALSLLDLNLEDDELRAPERELRENLSSLYSARVAGVTRDDVLLTSGAPAAVYTVLSSLLSAGDHVICQYPAEELLHRIPQSLGAKVSMWKTSPGKKWEPDVDDLQTLIQENTKLIIIQSPCDPTGAILPKPTLEKLVDIAAEKDITILAEEVYRPLFHSISPSSENFPPSTINLGYRKVVVVGSISKAYSLPGIRVGWIASRDSEIIKLCLEKRQLSSSSTSKLDELVAREAVSDQCIHALLARNIGLCQTKPAIASGFHRRA